MSDDADVGWLRTDGVNSNGAAAKVINFDGLGKRFSLPLLATYK